MTTVYPPGAVTRTGSEMLLDGAIPRITYTSADGARSYELQGGLSPLALGVEGQDGIVLQSHSGFSPGFKHIDSQGARENGVTWNDTVYQAGVISVILEAGASTHAGLSRVVSDWVAANDPTKLSRLEYFTPESGLWWCDVRLDEDSWKDQIKSEPRMRRKRIITQDWRNDHSFWRSTDSTSSFGFSYSAMSDLFNTDYSTDLGANWPQYYSGTGGYCRANGGEAVWIDSGTLARTVVNGPYESFSTGTDNQVIVMELGSMPQATFTDGAENHIWGRMGKDGSGNWNGYGVRVQIKRSVVKLSRFNNFVETVMAQRALWWPPGRNDKFTLVCGFSDNSRRFKVLRNGFEVITHTEVGTGSALGSSYRGVGFGMRAGAGTTQATPARVRHVSAGDNATVTQTGFCPLTNLGDQDGWPRYLCYGPGNFEFSNGPGTTEMIKFGPLLEGQVVLIDTRPRWRNVVDLTPGSLPNQVLNPGQKLIDTLIKLVTFNQVPPLLSWFESVFGIRPPQGVLYSLLDGRFSRPLPGVPQPSDAVASNIAVKITNGNAMSRVVAAVTPLRRFPECYAGA
jgi:hypothetical protein